MDALLFQSDTECPSPVSVAAQVSELTTPEQRAAVPADARVIIQDKGDHLSISIVRAGKTTVRLYRDAARDCERRAHFVSVLSVVALMPPSIAEGEPPVAAAAEPEPITEPRPTPESRSPPVPAPARDFVAAPAPATLPAVRFELAAVADFSVPIEDSVRVFSPGALVGVALGSGALRLTLSTHYAPSIDVEFTGESAGRAELEQLDVGVGARYVLGHAGVDTSIELGLLASRAQVRGQSAQRPRQDTAFSFGGRAGFHLGFGEQRLLSPFLSAHARLFPAAPAVAQLPAGTVGHLPYVWLGASAGLALAL